MSMHCKNYMQQYSKSKSIREINKSRASYKQLVQNTKTRQNSTTTAQLKLSAQKRNSEKIEKNASVHGEHLPENCAQFMSNNRNEVQPLLSSTQNIQSISNSGYGKLNTKMKIKVANEKSLRSLSSHDQLLKYQNSLIVSSNANIGIGLSNKKKSKLVTLSSSNQYPNTTSKKSKMGYDGTDLSQHQQSQSRSISQSHNNSVANSKYNTNTNIASAYKSIKKDIKEDDLQRERQKQIKKKQRQKKIEVITLNSSLLDVNPKEGGQKLDKIYERVKRVLQNNLQKQKQWQLQRQFYKQKIKNLQLQLEEANKKNMQKHARNSLIEYQSPNPIFEQAHHKSIFNQRQNLW